MANGRSELLIRLDTNPPPTSRPSHFSLDWRKTALIAKSMAQNAAKVSLTALITAAMRRQQFPRRRLNSAAQKYATILQRLRCRFPRRRLCSAAQKYATILQLLRAAAETEAQSAKAIARDNNSERERESESQASVRDSDSAERDSCSWQA